MLTVKPEYISEMHTERNDAGSTAVDMKATGRKRIPNAECRIHSEKMRADLNRGREMDV